LPGIAIPANLREPVSGSTICKVGGTLPITIYTPYGIALDVAGDVFIIRIGFPRDRKSRSLAKGKEYIGALFF
jgi:hypothetical protein